MTATKLQTIRSHAKLAQFMATLDADASNDGTAQMVGEIARTADLPASRYSFGPSYTVFALNGAPVVIIETAHRVFEVWAVDAATVQPMETL